MPASIDELFAGNLAVNLHKSNDDFETHTNGSAWKVRQQVQRGGRVLARVSPIEA